MLHRDGRLRAASVRLMGALVRANFRQTRQGTSCDTCYLVLRRVEYPLHERIATPHGLQARALEFYKLKELQV